MQVVGHPLARDVEGPPQALPITFVIWMVSVSCGIYSPPPQHRRVEVIGLHLSSASFNHLYRRSGWEVADTIQITNVTA